MSECSQTCERLTPYADGQLPPAERGDVERHLAACEPCRRAALAEQGARAVLRQRCAALRSEAVPPGLRTRCEALARARRPTAARIWAWRLVPLALVSAIVVVTAGVLFSLATHRSDTLLAAQLTADHAKCFRLFAGPESAMADAGRLERILWDEYGWDVRLPPSSPADGIQLIGARRCLYADGRIPHVMYRANGQDVSLYVLEGTSRAPADVTSFGHRSHIWSRGGTTYVLVAPDRGGDLARAVQYVMRETHGH